MELISRKEALRKLKKSSLKSKVSKMLKFSYGDGPESEVEVISTIHGNYDVEDVTFAFGDSLIEGLLEDGINDHSLFVVAGNLEVHDIITSSEMIIFGDLVVHGALVADSYGDYTLSVGGDVTVEEFAIFSHHLDLRGKMNAKKTFHDGEGMLSEVVYKGEGEDAYASFRLTADLVRDGHYIFE